MRLLIIFLFFLVQLLIERITDNDFKIGPISEDKKKIPEILCTIQVALEGQISKQAVLNSLSHGTAPSGDLIPWTLSQQFQDNDFPSLSGARVVRIATSPEYQRVLFRIKTKILNLA